MRKPIIAFYHDLVWLGGIESSELDLIKKLYYAGYKVIFAHKSQYFTRWDTINKISLFADILDINEDPIECDILIYSSLVFPYWELEDRFISKKRIGWIHFIASRQLGITMLDDKRFDETIDKFIAVSEVAKKGVLDYVPNANIEVIHNTIDIDRIRLLAEEPVDIDEDDDTLILVTVARISREKGFDQCVEIAQSLEDKKIKYKWFFIGGGSGGKYDDGLAEAIKGHNIEMVGYQDNPYKYIARAHYGVMISKEESWCIFNDECWILGVPTVLSSFEAIFERPDYKKYSLVYKYDLSDFKARDLIKNKDILKNNLKSYNYVNEYDKWVDTFIELLKEEVL